MSQPEAYAELAKQLWTVTGTDWHVSMSLTLTEPVCAYVDLESDDDELPKLVGFIGDGDANSSIKMACDYMLKNLSAFYADHPEKRRADASQ